MHIPKPFRLDSPEAIARILQHDRFGLLVTVDEEGTPNATALPFLYEGEGLSGRLFGHVAAANPQAGELRRMAAAGWPALAVFQGSHAYISPTWYGGGNHVPTWNYMAVHVRGVPRLIDDGAEVYDVLARMTAREEQGRSRPWTPEMLPADLLASLQRALVAFELPLSKVEAKAKLGQNKPAAARQALRRHLDAEGTPETRALLSWMDELEPASA